MIEFICGFVFGITLVAVIIYFFAKKMFGENLFKINW